MALRRRRGGSRRPDRYAGDCAGKACVRLAKELRGCGGGAVCVPLPGGDANARLCEGKKHGAERRASGLSRTPVSACAGAVCEGLTLRDEEVVGRGQSFPDRGEAARALVLQGASLLRETAFLTCGKELLPRVGYPGVTV